MGNDIALSFEHCDATAGRHHDANKRIFLAANTYDLFIFSYVANETSDKAKKTGLKESELYSLSLTWTTGWEFYNFLAQKAKKGAVMIFADVMQHSRVVLNQIAETMNESSQAGEKAGSKHELLSPSHCRFNSWWLEQSEFPDLKAEVLILHKP